MHKNDKHQMQDSGYLWGQFLLPKVSAGYTEIHYVIIFIFCVPKLIDMYFFLVKKSLHSAAQQAASLLFRRQRLGDAPRHKQGWAPVIPGDW